MVQRKDCDNQGFCSVQVRQSIINPDWDFQKMGIGGLSNEFNAIFRRAFASRVFPAEIIAQLGCKHVKGDLLSLGLDIVTGLNYLKVFCCTDLLVLEKL